MSGTFSNVVVSIIIVNYRSWHHLEGCLQALTVIESKQISPEIIVVDNYSADGNLTIFSDRFPRVQFIKNTGNNGFANGCNVGAKKSKGVYLLFLNPDTVANGTVIKKFIAFAKKYKNAGVVSCHQKNPNGHYEKTVRVFPNLFTLFGLTRAIYRKVYKSKIKNQYLGEQVVCPDWVSGSVIFMSRSWYTQVKGWNEAYWMYYEDVDLCKRVQEANGDIVLLKDVEMIHNHGGASRLNIKTAAITKTEVLISKHVYISNRFRGLHNFLSQLLVIVNNLIFKTVLASFGIIFFFIPKLRLNLYIYLKLMTYYMHAVIRKTWLSKRSIKYMKQLNA
ncbi:MAG: glycosyltransferase [Flavobacteriaceae bacterium]|nr:MAG: glycosyltransferase [Flavobacteriaceae bacterium]